MFLPQKIWRPLRGGGGYRENLMSTHSLSRGKRRLSFAPRYLHQRDLSVSLPTISVGESGISFYAQQLLYNLSDEPAQ